MTESQLPDAERLCAELLRQLKSRMPRDAAISLKDSQNASSRLTLVLWPERTTDRFITMDFMTHSNVRTA